MNANQQGNQPKTATVLISISSFFIMLFILNLINTYEQSIVEAKNKHFGGRTHEVVDLKEMEAVNPKVRKKGVTHSKAIFLVFW